MTAAASVLMVLAAMALAPRAAQAANTCNAFLSIDYPLGPDFALPDSVYTVGLDIGTGSINGGTQMQINRVRFELDCSAAGSLGIPCTNDGSLIEYEGDPTITTTCPGISFKSDHGDPASADPNEVVFTPQNAAMMPTQIVIPASTPNFCRLEFKVKVLSITDPDPTPTKIEEVAGYQASTLDAVCNNGLQSSGSQSGSINVCPTCTDTECSTALCNQTTGMCEFTPKAPSTPCGDTDANACTTAGCDGQGTCSQIHIVTVCPPDTNECTDEPVCNPSSGVCEYPPTASSTPCTDTDNDACTTAGCDGLGTCSQTHVVTVCPPDTNECTDEPVCNPSSGVCEYPPTDSSTPCTDTDNDECTTAGCDGLGVCNQAHIMCVTTTTTTTSTTTTTLGCVPVPEICNNMIDDDCDMLVDCLDVVDCSTNPACPVAKKDPTDIRFAPGLDRLRSKAVLETDPVDLSAVNVGILLSNRTQVLYHFEMPGSGLTASPDGKFFRFRNFEARTTGGLYAMKIKQQKDGKAYTVSTLSYADLSAATDPFMRVQFYIGGSRPYITKEGQWKQLPRGWRAPKDH